MDRARLQRIRNFQSLDFYPALIMRPITILVMLVIADWKFVSPNLLTTLGNVCKLAAAWTILAPEHWVLGVILLQLGLLFDHLDGTMARYRRTFTKLGSFYDKVSDMVTWWVIMVAVGWQTYRATGEAYHLVITTTAATALNVRGYMKWLANSEHERARWLEARADPVAAVAQRTQPIVIPPPPIRSRREWIAWFGSRLSHVVWFDEADLWFWLSLALVVDRLEWYAWLMFVTQSAACVAMIVARHIDMARLDAKLRALEHSGPADAPPSRPDRLGVGREGARPEGLAQQ
jgi:phosphatidylglycerophosphate synthase